MRLLPLVASLFLAAVPLCSRLAAADVRDVPELPDVPALVAGADQPPASFLVEAIVRGAPDAGVAFRVATDGRKQVCAVYDPSDGTPLMFSDGSQTLVYDLPNGRVVRLPNSRAWVRVDWQAPPARPFQLALSDDPQAKPLKFSFNVHFQNDPAKLAEVNSSVRVDRFVSASRSALRPLETRGGTRLFSAERAGGSVESIQVPAAADPGARGNSPAGPIDWFRFTSLDKKDDFYRLDLVARHIGRPVPPAALAFPAPDQLAKDFPLRDVDAGMLPLMLAMLRDGRAWAAKLALIDPKWDPNVPPPGVAAGVTWEELRRRDKELGSAYRAALAKQGVKFEAVMTRPE